MSGNYNTWALAQPGLQAYYRGNDASGSSTVVDSVAGNNLTKSAGGTTGLGCTINGLPAAFHTDGTTSSPFLSPTVAAFSLPTRLTYFGWMRFTADATTPVDAVGRPNVSAIRVQNPRGIRSTIVTTTGYPGGQPSNAVVPYAIPTNEWIFVAMTWSQESGVARMYVNGVLTASITAPGAIAAAATTAIKFGGTGVQADYAGWGVANQVYGAKRLRNGYIQGIDTPVTDVLLPGTVTAGQTVESAGTDGNAIASDEDTVVTGSGLTFRADQYALERAHVPESYPTTAADIADNLMKLANEMFIGLTQRGHSSDPQWFDGTDFRWSGSSGTFRRSTFALVVCQLATHRFAGLGSRRSRALEWACSYGDLIVSGQNTDGQFFVAPGGPASTDTYFLMGNIALATWIAGDTLGTTRRAAWVAAAERAADYLLNPLNSSYYVNGNLELDVAAGLHTLYLLTGKQKWKDAFDVQWTKTLWPTNAYLTSAGSGQGNAFSAGYGLRQGSGATGASNGAAIADVSALMALSDTTGKAYLSESANPGTVALDWDYLGIDVTILSKLWLMGRDPVHLKLLNVFVNKALERMNQLTTPVATAPTAATTGGTLAAGTYFMVRTALLGAGETVKSTEVSQVTTGATSKLTGAGSAVTGATLYRDYYGTSTGVYTGYIEAPTIAGLVYTGQALTAGQPPATGTAYNWVYDATGGSRHNAAVSWLNPALETLIWSGQRPDLAALFDLGAHFSFKTRTDFRGGLTSSGWTNENWWAYQQMWALTLMAAPAWL